MKKTLKILIITCVIFFVLICGTITFTNIQIKNTTKDRIITTFKEEYDCIIVLGAGVRKDGSPSSMLKDRLDKGIELYNKGVAPKIIMSGDHGQRRYDEVNTMKKYAIEQGVP